MSADLAEIQAQYELKKAEGETRGAAMLARIEAFLIRFVAYPSAHAVVAHVLWIVHTHAMAAWESTPRIAFLSPEPASGKTRALEVSELLVPRPIEAVNTSPAYLFRKVSDPDGLPTILFDEIDTVFGPKAKKTMRKSAGCSMPDIGAVLSPAAAPSKARRSSPRNYPLTARSLSRVSEICPIPS